MIIKLDNSEKSKNILVDYLVDVDTEFNIPLSRKINFLSFADKILSKGNVYLVYEDCIYCAMICFYCNDTIEHKAYLPILSTKALARGRGYAKQLIETMIEVCRLHKMTCILCDSVNPIAISIYKSMGFITYKEEYDGGVRKEFLIKDLK